MKLQVFWNLHFHKYSIHLKVTRSNSFNMERSPEQANRKASTEIRRVAWIRGWFGVGERIGGIYPSPIAIILLTIIFQY